MKREDGFKWLFLDLNSYFASVEQQENPILRNKPVIVTPMDTDYTCAIAASYEAKAYGIKTGTMVKDAKKMCPNLHVVVARHDKYVAYHNRIIEEVVKHTPINKICSIDELSSLLPPNKRSHDAAQKLSKRIKDGIRKNIGESIRCSIGFAPNPFLAKVACEMQKPDGLTILQQEEIPHALYRLNLTSLPGIGRNMSKRLSAANIFSVQDLCNISPKHARKIWRSVEGERFWYMLHGFDVQTAPTNTSVIGHSRVIDPDSRNPEKARLIAQKLLSKAAARMRNKSLFAQKISLSVRTKNAYRCGRDIKINATQNNFTLQRHVLTLWDEIMAECSAVERRRIDFLNIKKVSVTLYDLTTEDLITNDIFEENIPHEKAIHLKNDALINAIDKLQQKYKKDIVSIGPCPKTKAGYVGTKIAFARVPEQEEFWS